MFSWLEMHCWKGVTLIAAAFLGTLYGVSLLETKPPLDPGFAYVAMREYLQSSKMIDQNADLNFASSSMVEHNGEAIMSGRGSARIVHLARFELPVLEQVDMEFLAIVTRDCLGQKASCYSVQQMNITRQENIWPLI
jgi:hypothetical protein